MSQVFLMAIIAISAVFGVWAAQPIIDRIYARDRNRYAAIAKANTLILTKSLYRAYSGPAIIYHGLQSDRMKGKRSQITPEPCLMKTNTVYGDTHRDKVRRLTPYRGDGSSPAMGRSSAQMNTASCNLAGNHGKVIDNHRAETRFHHPQVE